MKKQIIGLIISIVFVLSMFITICANAKYIFTTQDYYSEKEVNEMLIQEYDKAVKENSDKNLVLKVSKLQEDNKKLLSENETLKSDNFKKEETIKNNKEIIDSLNSQISNLETNNEENEYLILDLTSQINELDKQNKLLEYEISENDYLIEENNKTITQLQNSIAYYEDFVNGLESDSEVFAIFVIENEIYNIQKLNKNGLAYLEEQPVFEEDATFNGWKVNGEIVDLSSYTLSCNTTFVADISYIYKVNFIVDDVVYNSQNVQRNDYAVLPETPIKEGYSFLGWSLNKVDIVENINFQSVVKNLTYYAIFEKSFNVNFMIGEEIYDSQLISENGSAIVPEVPVKEGYVFIGWTSSNSNDLNDVVSNISDLLVTSDINYYAYFVEDYEGRVFEMFDGETHYATLEIVNTTILIIFEQNYYLKNGTIPVHYTDIDNFSSYINLTFSSGGPYGATLNNVRSYNYKYYFNSDNQLVFSITPKDPSIVYFEFDKSDYYFEYGFSVYSYFYTVPDGSDLTNSISSMTCYSFNSYSKDNLSSVSLPNLNENILGWAIYLEDPNFDKTDMSDISSTDLIYIGDSGSFVDLSDFKNYLEVKLFAVYNLS